METAVVAARILLAAVFLAAAVGKLLDLSGARAALFGFGVPRRIAALAGPLIPAAELATAGALLLAPSAQWGGVAALLLLVAFLAGIANALLRGEAPDCHCFGIFHSSRAGPSAIYRNAALAAVAGFVAIQGPGPSVTGWIDERPVGDAVALVLGLAALSATAAALNLRRRVSRLEDELREVGGALAAVPPGLPRGAVAPAFDLPASGGGRVTLTSLTERGRPVLLVFTDRGCPLCSDLAPALGRWQAALAERVTIAVIARGEGPGSEPLLDDIAQVGWQREREVSDAYRVRGTPSAVLVSPGGRVASSLAQGPSAIEALVRLTLRREPPRVGLADEVSTERVR